MIDRQYNLLLADDDLDDCMFFREALEELPFSAKLTTVNDGIELMRHLSTTANSFPDVLFLDLNMPRKSGMECFFEIKSNIRLQLLPIIIFSTSMDTEVVNRLHEKGANYYIKKPGEFSQLKMAIHDAIKMTIQKPREKPERKNFVIQVQP